MQTAKVVLDLLPILVLGWVLVAVMFRLMGGPIPWPYPRHWRWGSKSLAAAYSVADDQTLKRARGGAEFSEAQLARVDWLDHNLRRN